MDTSARNVFKGRVSAVRHGAVFDEIELVTEQGKTLVASNTVVSTKRLGIEVGKDVLALVKASFIVLVANAEGYVFSTRNQFEGTVKRIIVGQVDAEVQLDVKGLPGVTAVITKESCDKLNLAVGSRVTALVKAIHVILAVKK